MMMCRTLVEDRKRLNFVRHDKFSQKGNEGKKNIFDESVTQKSKKKSIRKIDNFDSSYQGRTVCLAS